MSSDDVVARMREGWELYLTPRCVAAYLLKDRKKIKIPFAVAQRLQDEGVVEFKSANAMRLKEKTVNTNSIRAERGK